MISAMSAEPDPARSIMFVGRDTDGHWLVRSCHGQFEGRFIPGDSAWAFARAFARGRPGARPVAALRPLVPTVSFDPPGPNERVIDRAA